MQTVVAIDELAGVNWRSFDVIALDGRALGFVVAVYQAPTANRSGDDRSLLLIKVDRATDPATQRQVKRLLGIPDGERGWLV